MFSRKWSATPFLMLSVLMALSSQHAYGRRTVGTQASSVYGTAGGQAQWEWTAVATNPVNGIPVTTETVCAGSIDTTLSGSPVCDSTFVFLYQIPAGPNNMVVTFSGLSRFPFMTGVSSPALGFGVLLRDQNADPTLLQMLCSDLTSDDVTSLNLGWDVIDGDLIVTIPSVPVGKKLTFFIAEQPNPPGQPELNLTAPVISLGGALVVPPDVAFGSQESNTPGTPVTITIANSDDFSNPLNIKDVSTSNDFASAGSCSTLNPGDNCPLFLAFNPGSTGNLSGTLTLTDDTPPGTESVSLNGLGATPGLTLSPPSVVFGTQAVGTISDPISVTLSNAQSNQNSLQLIGVVVAPDPVTGSPDFAETDACARSIDPGKSCTFQITFSPTISGRIQSSITLTDNSPDGTHTILLSGNATETNTTTVSPSSLAFGNQTSSTTSATQTVIITNSGAGPLTVVAVTATAGFTIAADNCSNAGALGRGGTCTVSVAFQPAVGAHPYTGTLTVANDAIGGTLVIPLTGASLAAPAAPATFSPAAGTYTSIQTVLLSDSTAKATIYYTTDGTTPTTGSSVYSGPITVSATQTISAMATAPDYTASAVASALYTIDLPPPSFTITGSPVSLSAGASTGNTSTVTLTPAGGLTGSVTLSATITSAPSNAVNPPTLTFGSTSPINISGTSPATATLTITTTSSMVSALHDSDFGRGGGLAAGYAFFAFIVLLKRPPRESRWRVFLVLLCLLAAVTSVTVACGGGGGQPNTGHTIPGTTAGAYTITVTGVSGSLSETGTVALTVH